MSHFSVVEQKKIVLFGNKSNRHILYDMFVYKKQLEQYGYTIGIADEIREETITQEAIIAFEDIGLEKDFILLRRRKCPVYFIPNLEIDRKYTRYAYANMDCVDIIIAKTEGLVKVMKEEFPDKQVICIEHKTPMYYEIDESVSRSNNLIHVCGGSPYHNTENCVAAGLKLLDKYKYFFIVIDSSLPWTKTIHRNIRGMISNSDVKKRVSIYDNSKTSEEQKANLYSKCQVAICAYNADGFGHDILEAAGYGCAVITTDCVPLNELCTRQVAYAEVSGKKRALRGDLYEVSANAIIEAESRLPVYNSIEAQMNVKEREAKFQQTFERFEIRLPVCLR